MNTIGIVAEYNPFHYGHAYQIREVKERYPDSTLVILMSGNVVQRGEFAIIDKWRRAKIAVHSGADLVIELPLQASLQSADSFADLSVYLLSLLGIEGMVFGTESTTIDSLEAYVYWLEDVESDLNITIQNYLSEGYAYPRAYEAAVTNLSNNQFSDLDISAPNHILGAQYIRAQHRYQAPQQLLAIQRLYKDPSGRDLLSGSQIREGITQQSLDYELIPEMTRQAILDATAVNMGHYYPYIKHMIEVHTLEELSELYLVDEGFEGLIKKNLHQEQSYDSFVDSLISKRYTRAAVQRKLMSVLLNIKEERWQEAMEEFYNYPTLRILAFNVRGQRSLNEQRNNEHIHLFSNLTQEIEPNYQFTLRADRLYAMNLNHDVLDQVTGRFPYSY